MEININLLKKTFGDHTAVDISQFMVNHGDILGVVGNNGAGKTTLFRLMLDLLRADTGSVKLTPRDGEPIDPAESEAWKHSTGAYIDNGFLIDFLTPEDYFDFIGQVSGMSKSDTTARLDHFTQFMNGEILGQKKYIRDFSAGNKQKIGIIAALLTSPELVVLDEPFNFLDPSSQNALKKILTEHNTQTGATILLSSHNLQHTIEVSTRVALLEHGSLISDISNVGGAAEAQLEAYFNV